VRPVDYTVDELLLVDDYGVTVRLMYQRAAAAEACAVLAIQEYREFVVYFSRHLK
jgi:hypothetical protein